LEIATQSFEWSLQSFRGLTTKAVSVGLSKKLEHRIGHVQFCQDSYILNRAILNMVENTPSHSSLFQVAIHMAGLSSMFEHLSFQTW